MPATSREKLIAMSYAERVAQPCIGQERADLVLAGCAILEAMLRIWPCERLRVADRGLREGILATLMAEDGHDRRARPRGNRGQSGRASPLNRASLRLAGLRCGVATGCAAAERVAPAFLRQHA